MLRLKVNHKAIWFVVAIQFIITLAWHYLNQKFAHLEDSYPLDIAGFDRTAIYIPVIAGSIVLTYAMAYLYSFLKIETITAGLLLAFALWLCMHFQEQIITDIFSGKKVLVTLLNGSKSLLNYLLAGAFLGGWRKYEEPVIFKGYRYPGD